MNERVTEMSPRATEVLQSHPGHYVAMKKTVVQHLKKLQDKLAQYVPSILTEPSSECDCIRNLFAETVDTQSPLSMHQQGELAELSCDKTVTVTLQLRFNTMHLTEFWGSVQTEFPTLFCEVLKVLLAFVTSYICKTGFSTLAAIKTNYRTKLDVEGDIRLSLTEVTPQINKLRKEKQAHPSH